METLGIEKYDLDIDALNSICCEGYTDISGEWNSIPGKYYTYIQRYIYNINHNYEVHIHKFTKKWYLNIYMCLTATNSKNIELLQKTCRTLKESKVEALRFLQEYDSSEKAKEDIEKWKAAHANPVFIVNNGEPELIGTTYNYIGNDSMKHNDNYTYYNDDMPEYRYHPSSKFYQLCKSHDHLYIHCCEITPYGYCGSGIKDEILLNKMLEIIKPIPKYQNIINFVNKSNE